MNKLYKLLLATAILAPNLSYGWGKTGHQIVATLGCDLLQEETKEIVKQYLDDVSIPNAGTWMDDIRDDHSYDYTKEWHYINLGKNESYHPTDKANVVNELEKAINNLKNREHLTKEEIKFNLLVVFHLSGDIAQPLHAGYPEDFGGNKIKVSYLGKPSNLHKVWDSEIIQSEKITDAECKKMITALHLSVEKEEQNIQPSAWMEQGRNYMKDIYDYQNATITQSYVDKNKVTIEKQIAYASVRLAATLESIFSKPNFTGIAINKAYNSGDTLLLAHTYYTSHFVTSTHIPWIVEYKLKASDVNCANPIKRSNKFAPDPLNKAATNLDRSYKNSGYDRGHNMPAADNGCNGPQAMQECFYFSNMFPQTHRLNAGVWKSLEEQERDLAISDDSIHVWIGNYGIQSKIGIDSVVVPAYCWKVIYDYKTKKWAAYTFPNTTTVSGKPNDFITTMENIRMQSKYTFR